MALKEFHYFPNIFLLTKIQDSTLSSSAVTHTKANNNSHQVRIIDGRTLESAKMR
jgi:hypothetical protein